MLALTEKQTLIRALGQVIADKVRDELEPFRKQMADLQTTIAALPAPQAIIDHTTNVVENLCATWAPIPGKDGKDFDPSVIAPAIAEEFNARRANGLVVDLETVMEKARALVADAQIDMQAWASNYVEEQLKANLPKVRDGKDADMVEVGQMIDRVVARGLEAGATAREAGEAKIMEWARAYITEQFELCLPKVRDGLDGQPGKDAVIDWDYINEQLSAGMEMLREQLDKKIAALPKPEKGEKGDKGDKGDPGEPGKDGRHGTNGIDGKSVSLDELRSAIADLVVKAIGDIPLPRSVVGGFVNRDGRLHLTYSDGGTSDLGEIVGKDGRDCDMETVKSLVSAYLATIEKPKDGKDGLGFDDLQLEFDGERLVQLKFIRGEEAKIFDLEFPTPLFKDIWKEGDYKRGHIVVRDGSMWIAQKDTSSIPGQPDSDWKLCTKRGRDGKDGKAGLKGEKGDPGRPGRDLTQIGPDGSKW